MSARYVVVKNIMESPCEHPKCEQLHQRFMNQQDHTGWFHMTTRTEWIVVDIVSEYCEHLGVNKKDCVEFAKRANAKAI